MTDETCYYYTAPCGRTLRNEVEVAFYLHITKCDHVTVDQFTFRGWERVNFVYRSDEKALIMADYTNGKEATAIPVVNSIDTEPIPKVIF
jgi:histone-lysine N-methyltransferase SETDB1